MAFAYVSSYIQLAFHLLLLSNVLSFLTSRGLASVFELLAALVSAIVDTVSRPTLWGIPMELASMLPFSDAYFPHKYQFLRILTGPLSSNSLVTLAHNCKPTPIKVQALDDKTEW